MRTVVRRPISFRRPLIARLAMLAASLGDIIAIAFVVAVVLAAS